MALKIMQAVDAAKHDLSKGGIAVVDFQRRKIDSERVIEDLSNAREKGALSNKRSFRGVVGYGKKEKTSIFAFVFLPSLTCTGMESFIHLCFGSE